VIVVQIQLLISALSASSTVVSILHINLTLHLGTFGV